MRPLMPGRRAPDDRRPAPPADQAGIPVARPHPAVPGYHAIDAGQARPGVAAAPAGHVPLHAHPRQHAHPLHAHHPGCRAADLRQPAGQHVSAGASLRF